MNAALIGSIIYNYYYKNEDDKMTDHKFTDDTIDIEKYAKALNNLLGVDSAYFAGDKDVDAIVEIIVLAKKMENTIKSQNAELEDLREIVFMDRSEAIKNLKAEAIKEFAERLKANMSNIARMEYGGNIYFCVGYGLIDDLVKEMTEGHNESQNT